MAGKGKNRVAENKKRREKKKAKREQEMRAAGTWVEQREFEEMAVAEKNTAFERRCEKAMSLSVPEDCVLENVRLDYPDTFEELRADPTPRKDKDADLNRVIWYNQLDRNYTFDTSNHQAGKNFRLLASAHRLGAEISLLKQLYYAALLEVREGMPGQFSAREYFLGEWNGSSEDIGMPYKKSRKGKSALEQMLAKLDAMTLAVSDDGMEIDDVDGTCEGGMGDGEEGNGEDGDGEDEDEDGEGEMTTSGAIEISEVEIDWAIGEFDQRNHELLSMVCKTEKERAVRRDKFIEFRDKFLQNKRYLWLWAEYAEAPFYYYE